MHHYHKLQEKIASHPVGAPKSDEFLEILKILYRPDEIEIAALLDFRLRKVSEIADKAGISEEEALQKLEAIANRGALLAKKVGDEPAYALLPNYPGLLEYPVMKGLEEPARQRLAQLWHAYWMNDMAAELASANPPWNRVFPAENALPGEIEILPYEVASQMMAKNEVIALADCPCRVLGRNCDKPLDVCLVFDGAARFLAERSMAKLISLEEARQVLKKSEEAALVHTGSNNAEKLMFMCNCCPCCCHMLMLLTKREPPKGLAKSSYQARFNVEACINCGICEERCPMGAYITKEDTIDFSQNKCIGCGLCISTCPTDAIILEKRGDYSPPAKNISELIEKVTINKRTRKN